MSIITSLIRVRRRSALALAGAALTSTAALALAPAAQAHSLQSSTINLRLTDTSAAADISVALATVDEVLGTDYATSTGLTGADYTELISYLDEHFTVTGADGSAWAETWSAAERTTVEGIESLTAHVSLDTAGADPADLTLSYDAIIEDDAGHQAVVVLTDADGEISSPGVLTADDSTLTIGDSPAAGLGDMLGYGFRHVLEGADHLLFLLTLLLVAPVTAVHRRWRRPDPTNGDPAAGIGPTLRRVLAVVTAFTVGHSLTLIASALGWISLPGAPVEVAIAVSVAAAAVHAVRPLARRGEVVLAGMFGLVHGLAFAGILADLGLSGGTSLLALLSFNLGVELAQLAVVATVFPSVYAVARTRYEPVLRIGAALVALLAAAGWIVDRLGLLPNPFTGIEDAVIGHPWLVVLGCATAAGLAVTADRSLAAPAAPAPQRSADCRAAPRVG